MRDPSSNKRVELSEVLPCECEHVNCVAVSHHYREDHMELREIRMHLIHFPFVNTWIVTF